MVEFLMVGIGGFVGSCLRFALTKLGRGLAVAIPFGTLISNIVAGLLIGFFIGLEQGEASLSPRVKLLLTTGLCGGLSTFSAFSLETVTLFGDGKYGFALLNIFLNVGVSCLCVALGITAAKAIAR